MKKKILTFLCDQEMLGIDVATIREIIPRTDCTPLVSSPPCLLGVIHLRNETIPVIDLAFLLGKTSHQISENNDGEKACFIIVKFSSAGENTLAAFLVSELRATYVLESEDLESAPMIDQRMVSRCIASIGKTSSGSIPILDVEELLKITEIFSDISLNKLQTATKSIERIVEDRLSLLSLKIGEELYAVPLNEVNRIIPVKEYRKSELVPLCLDGLMEPNGLVMGFIDVSRALKLKRNTSRVPACGIVISYEGFDLICAVDSIGLVFKIDQENLRKSGIDHEKMIGSSCIKGFAATPSGVAQVLSFRKILNADQIVEVKNWKSTIDTLCVPNVVEKKKVSGVRTEDAALSDDTKNLKGCLLVKVGPYRMGIPIQDIKEILAFRELLQVPLSAHDFAGILPLRGKNYNIMDLRKHFDFNQDEKNLHSVIVILKELQETDHPAGFLVDDIEGRISLEGVPLLSREKIKINVHRKLFVAVAKRESEELPILSVKALLTDTEKSQIRIVEDFLSQARKKEEAA